MKIRFDPPQDGRTHVYCISCNSQSVRFTTIDGCKGYVCPDCDHRDPRALIIDPKVKWWLDAERTYWHEVSGIWVVDSRDRLLFFDRVKPPFGLTPPAGHVDFGEHPSAAAIRELSEETGLHKVPVFIGSAVVNGDSCRRGSDDHVWYSYLARLGRDRVTIDPSEGVSPVWLTIDEALKQRLTPVARHVLERYGQQIRASVA